MLWSREGGLVVPDRTVGAPQFYGEAFFASHCMSRKRAIGKSEACHAVRIVAILFLDRIDDSTRIERPEKTDSKRHSDGGTGFDRNIRPIELRYFRREHLPLLNGDPGVLACLPSVSQAHTLKSSSHIVVARTLADVTAHIELLAANQELHDVEECLPKLQSAADQACDAIRSWLNADRS